MFNSESGLVKIWVRLIESGQYTKDIIPALSNLREVVLSVLEEKGI